MTYSYIIVLIVALLCSVLLLLSLPQSATAAKDEHAAKDGSNEPHKTSRLFSIGNASAYGIETFPTIMPPRAIMSCNEYRTKYTSYKPTGRPPPQTISGALKARLTQSGKFPFAEYFVDDTNAGKGTHYIYPAPLMEQFLEAALERLAADEHLPTAQGYFVTAIRKYLDAMEGANAVVFGSMEPWLEALIITAGGDSITTFDYNKLTYGEDRGVARERWGRLIVMTPFTVINT